MTKINAVFINLPVEDLSKTRAFWTSLGFGFNEDFCDNNALCLMLNDGSICSMLIRREFFTTFTNRPISDGKSTQVLICISVNSREEVDKIISLALKNGGRRYRKAEDHGWMYYDCFADPDGHQWEVMYSDESKLDKA